MAAIVQISPLSDSVAYDVSAGYMNQLNVQGNVGAVVYTTTSASPSLSMSNGGAVTATGFLPLGPYTVSGMVADTHGNSGTWTFTLTVVITTSPPTSVVPAVPTLPTGVEIAVPFHIDPSTGGVAVLFDYPTILEQHIKSIVLTMFGERVMNPAYGSDLSTAVFKPIQTAEINIIAKSISDSIKQWEPAVHVISVVINPSSTSDSTLIITINWSVVPFSNVNTLTVSTGGTIAQVTAP